MERNIAHYTRDSPPLKTASRSQSLIQTSTLFSLRFDTHLIRATQILHGRHSAASCADEYLVDRDATSPSLTRVAKAGLHLSDKTSDTTLVGV
jgi:hypothetical protein